MASTQESDVFGNSILPANNYIEVLADHEHYAGDNDESTPFFVSGNEITILHYKGFQFVKACELNNGTRWICATNELCGAFLYLNKKHYIVISKSKQKHDHRRTLADLDSEKSDTAIEISSRKGRKILLFRKYTYRKQYDKRSKCRWVCSTMKNCRGCIFTGNDNYIISAFEEHCHDPPKYYLNPDHVLEAYKEPLYK